MPNAYRGGLAPALSLPARGLTREHGTFARSLEEGHPPPCPILLQTREHEIGGAAAWAA